MPKMVSMEMDDDEKLDHLQVSPGLASNHPYGLRIALTEKEFEKLGLDSRTAQVGEIVHGQFMGRVTHCSHDENEHGEHCRVEIQIEDLGLEDEDEEYDEEE